MKYSAIILAGGASKRFKNDKGLFNVFQKPLISYVIRKVKHLADEVVIVTSKIKASDYSLYFPSTKILTDEYDLKAAISGALTGFKNAMGNYSILLPCDTPLVSQQVLSLLFDLAPSNDAVIPRWPSGYIEPLQAVYSTERAYKASLQSINDGEYKMKEMVSRLKKVLYLPTPVIKQFDPNLLTFHNINRIKDLEDIKELLKQASFS